MGRVSIALADEDKGSSGLSAASPMCTCLCVYMCFFFMRFHCVVDCVQGARDRMQSYRDTNGGDRQQTNKRQKQSSRAKLTVTKMHRFTI